jgi:hypothetical protein
MNHITNNTIIILTVIVIAVLYSGCNNSSGTEERDDGRQMVYTVPFDVGDSVESVMVLAQTIDADSVIIHTNNIDTLQKYRLIIFIDYREHEVRLARYYVEGFHIYDIILKYCGT